MSAQDELAAIIDDRWYGYGYNPQGAAAAILAAGYRKPHTITTAIELDALAKGTVLRDLDGDVLVADPGPEDMWFRQVDETWPLSSQTVALPATVLYEPEAGA